MKKIFIGLAFIVVAVAAMPFAMGFKVESSVQEQITYANTVSGAYFETRLAGYQRGYNSSTAQSIVILKLSALGSSTELEDIPLHFNHEIQHGPIVNTPQGTRAAASYVVTRIDTSKLSAEKMLALKKHLTKPDDIFVSRDLVSFYGEVETHASVTGVNIKEDKSFLDFAGIEAQLNSNLLTHAFSGVITLGAVNSSIGENGFAMQGGKIDVDLTEQSHGLWLGEQNYVLNELVFSKAGTELVSIDTFKMDSTTQAQSRKLDSAFAMAAMGVESIIPVVKNAAFDFELNQLPLSAVEKMQALLKETEESVPADATMEQRQALFMSMFVQHGAELFNMYMQTGVELKLGLNLDSTEGKGKAELGIGFNGVDGSDLVAAFMESPENAIKGFNGEMKVDVDEALFAMVPGGQQVEQGVQMGFVKREEGKLISQLKLENAIITVNEAMQLPVMQMLAGMK